ncbi:MAG: hypothetical protein GXN96_04345 [Aquificae bacterium]|nr:hypothetical protein [Aquificota bacterium]
MSEKILFILENSSLLEELICLEEADFSDETMYRPVLDAEGGTREDSFVNFSDVKV